MDINGAFPSKYLRAADLLDQETGEYTQPVVTIEHVVMEPVGQDRTMKPVVFFKGKDKGVVLNKTNSKVLINITGSTDTDKWMGIQIKLYVAEVSFQGEMVDAIRFKSPLAVRTGRPAPQPVVPEDDSIPF